MYYLKPQNMQFQENIENLYREFCQIRVPSGELLLDLSETNWMFPYSILSIITIARLWLRWTGQPTVLTNMDDNIHRYLERMNLFSECQPFLRALQPPKHFYERSSSSQRLLEVVSVPSDEQLNIITLRNALRRAKAILTTWINDPNLVGSVLTMFSEIGQNIVHSQDQGYVVIQRYKQPYSDELALASEIHLSISDIGIGIEESLVQHDSILKKRLSNGSDFIQHALIEGVSGQSGSRGIGLHRVRELVHRWHGSFTIRSNGSQIHIANQRVEIWDELSEIPGVQILIVVRGTANG